MTRTGARAARGAATRLGLASLAVAALASGCASILGDFTNDTSSNGGGDGGPDTSVPVGMDGSTPQTDSPTGSDSPAPGETGTNDGGTNDTGTPPDAADAAVYLLTCTLASANPIVVDDLANNGNQQTFTNPPSVLSVNQQLVVILEPFHNGVYTLYWVDKSRVGGAQNPVTGVLSAPLNGANVLGFERVANATAIVETTNPGGVLPGVSLGAPTWSDGLSMSSPGQNPDGFIGLSPNRAIPNGNNVNGSFIELTPGSDYFYGVTYVPQTADAGTLAVGHSFADGGATFEILTNSTYHGGTPKMIHAGTDIYVFDSSDPVQGGALLFKVPDNGVGADGGLIGRPLSGAIPALVLDVAAGAVAGMSNIALAEFNPNGTPLATLRAGSLPASSLDTFKAADIPIGPQLNDSSELPISKGTSGTWAGDEFAFVGLGSPLPAGGGANLIAMDAQGHTRALQVGANAILGGHTTIDGVSISLSQRLGTRYVTWNLVWSELKKSTDGGLDYDVLYLSEMICH
jgi:hypothetical protein